ncbi:MAG: hypothetical protein ABJ081_11915 [Hyphomicrobiales bacterium]
MTTVAYYDHNKSKTSKTRKTSYILTFCLFWTILTSISLLVDALLWNKVLDERQVLLISFGTIASMITAYIAWYLEQMITRKRPATARFSTMFILLAVGTIGATYLCSALYTIAFFIDNMNPITSLAGLEDLLYFFLSHGYSFAVSTARLFLPLGFFSLILACIFYCILCQSSEESL